MSPLSPSSPPLADLTPEAIERFRSETPGIGHRTHLNNAGAGLMPEPVHRAMTEYLQLELEMGGYEAAAHAREAIDDAYRQVARLVGSAERNVALVENSTVALAQALSAFDFAPGDLLLTSRIDYPSNQLMYLSLAERRGLELVRAPDLPEGGVDPEAVARLLGRHPGIRLVSITWVPTNTGLIQDVAAVGRICREAGVPFLIDACQAVGQLPIEVEELGCDYLTASARKFLRGPRGAGFLYVSDEALARGDFPLYVDLHGASWVDPERYELRSSARRFENWEFSYALVRGLGEAARYALEADVAACGLRAAALAEGLRERLAEVEGVRVLDRGERLAAIVTAQVEGWTAEELMVALRERRINTSVLTRESGVLDMDDKGARDALRLSPHYYNLEAELDLAVEALAELAADRRP